MLTSCALAPFYNIVYRLIDIDYVQAKPETVDKVCEIVRKQLALSPESELTPDSKFSALGADSLDTVSPLISLKFCSFDLFSL